MGYLAKIRRRREKVIAGKEWIFLAAGVVWILLYNLIFMRWFMNWLVLNPTTPIPFAMIVHELGYLVMWAMFGFVLFKKPLNVSRFAIGLWFLLTGFVIAMPPLCISAADGNLLSSPDNMSCRAGGDATFGWLFNGIYQLITGQQLWGHQIMFYLVYILGTLTCFIAAAIILKEKELWRAFGRR